MTPTKDADLLLERARRALDDGAELPPELPATIRASWRRSRLAAVPRDRVDVPFAPGAGPGDRLRRAADPVLGRFAQQLGGTRVSIVLADRDARVVGRWAGDRPVLHRLAAVSIAEGFLLAEDRAGTNGLGTALEELGPVVVRGAEHYTEPLQGFVCVGVPIRQPITRRVEGVLNLACLVRDANGLLLPTVLDLGAQIEHELAARSSARDQVVFERFLTRSRETSAALIALGGQFMLTNAAAADLLTPSDQALLWDQAAESFGSDTAVARAFRLSTGEEVAARCTPVRLGGRAVGALIEVDVRQGAARRRATPRPAYRSAAWAALERTLARFALGPGHRLRILGEPGSGRSWLAEAVHRRHAGGGPLTVVCATRAAGEGPAWVARVAARLHDPRGTLVLRRLDALADDVAGALADLLGSVPATPLVVSTADAGDGRAYRPVEHRFGDQVVAVPALRDRRDDLPDLVHAVLRARCPGIRRIARPAMAALIAHRWPGNVRELVATLAEAAARAEGDEIGLAHLPAPLRDGAAGHRRLTRIEEIERSAIAAALREHDGNKNRAAESLGISRSTLYRRMRRFGLDVTRSVL